MMNHVSPSALDTFTRCARQWMYRYVERMKSPPGAAAYLGKGAHAAAELSLGRKMQGRTLPSEEEVSDVAADKVRGEWELEAPLLGEDERERGEDAVKGETVDGAISAAQAHLRILAPIIEPIALEAKFEISVPGLPRIIGYKDVETLTLVRDLKTGHKGKTQKDADASTQLTIYAMEADLEGRRKGVALDSIAVQKCDTKVETLESRRDAVDFGRVLDRLAIMDRQVVAGLFPPADPTSWVCSPRWCGYWNVCAHGGKRQVLVQIRKAA